MAYERSRPPRLLALAGLAATGLALAAPQLEGVPWALALARAGGLWMLLLGAALPLVLLRAADEPSPLKVVYFSSLLSPPLLALGFLALRPVLGPEGAVRSALALAGLGQLVPLLRPWHRAPLGRPAWLAVLLAPSAGLALLAALEQGRRGLLLGSPAPLWHALAAGALRRPGPLEHPLLAGTDLPGPAGLDVLLGAASLVLGVEPHRALAWLAAAALASLPVGLYLIAAPLYREGRRCALAAPVALLCAAPLLPGADGLWPGGEPLLLAPWSLFLEPGPAALALPLLLGSLAAAVHAVRHGQRPWPELMGSLLAAGAVLEPRVGLLLAGALALGVLLHPGLPRLRAPLLAVLALAVLPAWAVLRLELPLDPPLAAGPGRALGAAVLPALLVLPLLGVVGLAGGRWWRAGGTGDGRGRRTILVLVAAVALAGVAAGPVLPGPAGRGILALGLLGLGILAAGGVGDLLQARSTLPAGGLLLLLLGLGGGRALLGGWGFVLEANRRTDEDPAALSLHPEAVEPDLEGSLERLGPEPPPNVFDLRGDLRRLLRWRQDGRDLARALTWLREEAPRADRPVLVAAPSVASEDLRRRPAGYALAADLPLWVSGPPSSAEGSPRHAPRAASLAELYGTDTAGEGAAPPAARGDLARELALLQRPAYVLVEGADRSRTRRQAGAAAGIDTRLLRLGARSVLVLGRVEVLRLDPRPER